ncbi:zinc-dependent alcohol dehydrogenase [Cohnella rhizosphaerae]|uniref:Zinc-binding alcohol dehydrogenase n=1 Tax=Cohnella rhizosphaerae TaxID=1457232 RepID=A0A9X4KR33_9BACL|nr:zinc-binding alcohol dehydrogenase [Cohnella rhizosphaerae]MDG0809103.1 zinc-binding alcohol dehydrogenase [Cohnella rhizosphaerae]
MSLQGKAVVFTDRQRVEVHEVRLPAPSADDVVIDVEISWISNGTESSFLRGERTAGDTPYAEGHPWPFPIVAGYQKVGTVLQVGSAVSAFKPGDRVFATISKVEGMYEPYGGHVSPAVTAADQVWKLPQDADPLDYSGLVLAQVGYNCGERPPIREGSRALVIGDGLVGHWAAQTLHHRGSRVTVLGRHEDRMRLLPETIGHLRSGQQDTGTELRRLAEAQGLDILVDTVGDMDAVTANLPLLAHDSHFVSAGFYGNRGLVDIQALRDKEITLHAPAGWNKRRMDAALEGIRQGWLQTGKLVTHRFPVDRAAEAWELIVGRHEPYLGVVLEWRQP